jgi:signal peptidase I
MNFPLIMLIALVVTGVIWLYDIYVLRPKRRTDAKEPLLVEYSRSFFPVILVVFMLRSFLVEPFKIPSGSMMPTLLVGDFILVNKYAYGIRLPVANKKIVEIGQPQHGDVMVFRYPEDPSLDYIKRVVGVPGDKISYRNKQLTLNDKPLKQESNGGYSYVKSGLNFVNANLYREQLGEHNHQTLVQPDAPTIRLGEVRQFSSRDQCVYNEEGFTCTVPQGYYFMMGDNRDDSNDSRYWGFVPERNIVGKAFMIWWNFDDLKRIGKSID